MRELFEVALPACDLPGCEPGCCDAPALILREIVAGYGSDGAVLKGIDLTVPEGACWGILGPSGGGKTTLLRVVLGVLRPDSGSVERPLAVGLNGGGRGAIGYIPQNLGLVRNLTVRANVLLGALSRVAWWRSITGRFPRAEAERAEEALASVGLAGRGDDRIETLSGGERRRVAIARALLQRPRLLLADEFLAELDALTAQEVMNLIQELRRTTGMTILFVDHNVEAACSMAERVVVLVHGRKVCELDPARVEPARIRDLFRHPLLA